MTMAAIFEYMQQTLVAVTSLRQPLSSPNLKLW